MKLLTSGRYGTRIMCYLAIEKDKTRRGRPITLTEISSNLKISRGYAGILLAQLAEAGLVTSVKGKKGGYYLERPAGKVNILQIIRAVGTPVSLYECIGCPSVCKRSEGCKRREFWSKINRDLEKVMARYTLAHVATHNKRHPDEGIPHCETDNKRCDLSCRHLDPEPKQAEN